MKATIYINRHIITANKKASRDTDEVVDEAAVTVKTYLGTIRCKEIDLTWCKLKQDATAARCSGATIWLETDFENLVIDGKQAHRDMFNGH